MCSQKRQKPNFVTKKMQDPDMFFMVSFWTQDKIDIGMYYWKKKKKSLWSLSVTRYPFVSSVIRLAVDLTSLPRGIQQNYAHWLVNTKHNYRLFSLQSLAWRVNTILCKLHFLIYFSLKNMKRCEINQCVMIKSPVSWCWCIYLSKAQSVLTFMFSKYSQTIHLTFCKS